MFPAAILNNNLRNAFFARCMRAFFLLLILPVFAFSQTDSNTVLTFNFNDHKIEEVDGKIEIKPVGVSLTKDRFGNDESAIYMHGHSASYLNLGTSKLLKSKSITVSIWVNLDRRVYSGKGYECNPVIITKNGPGHDYIAAYGMVYDCYSNRYSAGSTRDSLRERNISSVKEGSFGKWYHLVLTFDNKTIAFYENGELQQQFPKDFETQYLESDSVVIGNFASTKNDRYSQGTFDDIQIFHRVLSAQEIKELYEAPDPNRWNGIIRWALMILAGIVIIGFIYYLISKRYERAFEKEKEKNDLINQLNEMEMKAMKAQMNPHFMFNSLNTIQHFILANENDNAYRYLVKFSKLLRKILESNTSESILLEEEADILKRYLEIESLRFEGIFNFKFETDEKLLAQKAKIPHMLIQPFIENAIWHGLLHKDGDKNLFVQFNYINEKALLCIIDDDGVGRKKADSEAKLTYKKKSLAIDMIKQRLHLVSKTKNIECGFEIIDKKNSEGNNTGTTVKITIPILN